jgi:hypothetical protein
MIRHVKPSTCINRQRFLIRNIISNKTLYEFVPRGAGAFIIRSISGPPVFKKRQTARTIASINLTSVYDPLPVLADFGLKPLRRCETAQSFNRDTVLCLK